MAKAEPGRGCKAAQKPIQGRPARKPEPNTLRSALRPNETKEARQAEFMVEGVAMNSLVGLAFASKLGDLDLTECFAQMLANAQAAANGDRRSQESILAAQVISTNAIYTDLALIARANLDKGLDLFERLMRLALKAQSNCRATAETLAIMQNPPTVFARQANIANGPQQINNGVSHGSGSHARAGENQSRPNKLLEADGERMDGEPTRATIGRDTELETVGAIHRPSKSRR